MRNIIAVAALSAALPFAVPAFAQDSGTAATAAAQTDSGTPTAPDGTRAFGIEPYVGVLGGWERFDRQENAGIPVQPNGYRLDGALVQAVAGVNVPLGPVFVGAEGNVAKGVSGDIDWEYGAAGRFGVRAGESGLIYGKVGYQWVNFDKVPNATRDYHAMTYGLGVEVGPKDIGLGGITGNSGVRLRLEMNTFNDAKSFRPMAGVIAHF
ncbi:opacity protein [Sphingomonas pokkalii]|uniref:Opacity protein n=1 Tax=Sphingomonas pokkalii TaxID=2175090 RepID=A0A2U0SE68_9SPHN|nr:opacity protein [Sphingomonas pokkalii]PVX29663.1 opacity protein [Sphingomonas pokkalii]